MHDWLRRYWVTFPRIQIVSRCLVFLAYTSNQSEYQDREKSLQIDVTLAAKHGDVRKRVHTVK